MSISIISDVHIREAFGKEYNLMCRFLEHPEVKKSEKVILLGDIFNLMVGSHRGYISKYKELFIKITKLLEDGVEIHFVEGNHDFHLMSLFRDYFNRFHGKSFFYHTEMFELNKFGKKIVFCHGDDIEIDNDGYRFYRFMIKSFPARLIINNVLTFSYINKVGDYWNKKSYERHRIYNRDEFQKKIKAKFRVSAEKFWKKSHADIIVAGHSHTKDYYLQPENKYLYINNGEAFFSKTFIHIDSESAQFISLS